MDWSVSVASDLESIDVPNENLIEEILNWNVERIVNLSDTDQQIKQPIKPNFEYMMEESSNHFKEELM